MTSPISKKQKLRPRYSDDVIEIILSRLPVTSLKRLQGVSKSWEAMISDQDFVEKHLCHVKKESESCFQILLQTLMPYPHHVGGSRKLGPFRIIERLPRTRLLQSLDYKASLKFLKEDDDAAPVEPRELELEYYTDFNMDPDRASMVIFGSVNGLVCYEFNQTDIVIWNPSTSESKLLPPATVNHEGHGIASVFYGFGYDNKTKDYKVVRGSYKGAFTGNMVTRCRYNFVEVFSLKRGSWSAEMNCENLGIDEQGCLVNETLYWIDRREEGDLRSFDLAEEKFSMSVQPLCSFMREHTYIGGALNINNCLVVYALNFDRNWQIRTKEYKIWVMRDSNVHDDSWTEVANIISDEFLKPICVLEGGEVLAVVGNTVAWYCPRKKVFMNVIGFDRKFFATKYIETLVSPRIGSVEGGSSGTASTSTLEKEAVK